MSKKIRNCLRCDYLEQKFDDRGHLQDPVCILTEKQVDLHSCCRDFKESSLFYTDLNDEYDRNDDEPDFI